MADGHVLPAAQCDAVTLVGNVLFSGKSLTLSLGAELVRHQPKQTRKKKALTA